MEIKIEPNAIVRVHRDGDWTILYVEDGGGGKATVSLTAPKALDLAALLKGTGIAAAGVTR